MEVTIGRGTNDVCGFTRRGSQYNKGHVHNVCADSGRCACMRTGRNDSCLVSSRRCEFYSSFGSGPVAPVATKFYSNFD